MDFGAEVRPLVNLVPNPGQLSRVGLLDVLPVTHGRLDAGVKELHREVPVLQNTHRGVAAQDALLFFNGVASGCMLYYTWLRVVVLPLKFASSDPLSGRCSLR